MKIHSNFLAPAFTKFDPAGYIPSPAYGVNRFMLDRIGNEKARATTIVQYQPNSKFPEHTHIGGEEFLVLTGRFKDQFGEFPAGTYVRNPVGSQHAPWVDNDGCTIFVKLLQMADTGEGVKSLYVMCVKPDNDDDDNGNSCKVLELYENKETGERVQMVWLMAGEHLAVDSRTAVSEELFVYEGSLLLGEEEEYSKWGWLRFPVDSDKDAQRQTVRAGLQGAQVFRKTGHLTTKALSMEKVQIGPDETVKA